MSGGSSPRRSGTGAVVKVAAPLPVHHNSVHQHLPPQSHLVKPYEPYRFSLDSLDSLDSAAAAAAAAHSLQPPQQQLAVADPWGTAGHASTSSRPHTADAVAQGGLVGAYPLVLPHSQHSHLPTFYSPPPPPPAPLPWHVRSNSLPKYSYGDMAANQTFNGDDLTGAEAVGGGKHSPIKASPPPPPPIAKEDYSADYTAEDYAHFSPSRRQQQQQHVGNGAADDNDDDDDGNGNGQFQRHGIFTPLEESRDSFGDGGALYGSHIYEPQQQQQQQQRAVDDSDLAAYRRFSTPSIGYPADGGMDSRASNRPFRWSADFTQYDNAGGGSFAPPAPPQHPLYQPQYLQSANPYHQPVSYAHGGTYQHPAYSRPSTADGQQQQQQQQHYLQQQQQQQAPATYTLPVQRQQQPAPPLISFAPPPPPGASDIGGGGGPPSLSLDTSHNALSAAAKFVSPPSATTSLPAQRPVQGQSQTRTGGGPASASPWSGPPPPLSLSLGVSASSLAARRRNTTDFTTLSQSLPASGANGVDGDASSGRPGGDRTRVASADGTYSLGNGGGPGGKPLSATTTTSSSHLSATGSSGPTSATSAHPSGSHSGASSAGGVPTLSSIKEPMPSSPRSEAVDGGDEDAEGEQDVEEPAPSAEGDELDEDDGDDEEEARDDTDGEYRPGGGGNNGATASSSSKRRAGARAGGDGGGSRKRGGRAGAGGASGLERRATTAGSSTSQGERPAKRRKSEADGELEKKFTCPHPSCGRAFARNFNLQAHIKSHQGIREFKCPECFKLFSRKHDCTRHCISIHNYDKDGTAPPERQPVYVAQKVLPVNVMVERAQERQRAAVGTGDKSNSDDYPPRNSNAAPLFSGRPLAVKRDGTDERSPLLSHAPFVPPHPAYSSQYRAGQDDGRDSYGGYASTSSEQQQQLPPQAAPPPSLSFDHPSMQPTAGPGQQQQQQKQQHQPQE